MVLPNISYDVSYRNIKYPRLEFKTGELLIILPFGYKHDSLLDKHKGWIIRKSEFIKECLKKSLNKKLIKRTDKQFKDIVYPLIEKTSKKLGVELNAIYFRNMRTKWASCSAKRNLTINRLSKYLPDSLIRYIIFHEMAHMLEKKHNETFWKIISKKFNNYQQLENDLFIYWFKVTQRV
jgi:predicted metal-dependent hydrolase